MMYANVNNFLNDTLHSRFGLIYSQSYNQRNTRSWSNRTVNKKKTHFKISERFQVYWHTENIKVDILFSLCTV